MANTHNLNAQVWRYILDCIQSEDVDLTNATDKEKVDFAWAQYCEEGRTPYHLHTFKGNEVNAFADFLRGLPSWFALAYDNDDILALAREWGSLPKRSKPYEEQRILDGYWGYIAVKFFQLRDKLKEKDYLNPALLTVNL